MNDRPALVAGGWLAYPGAMQMESKQFEVEVVYQQRVRYLVEAESDEEAEGIALEKWRNAEEEDELPDEECCDEVVSVAATEVADPQRASDDRAVVLRFLRDRELVIETLDGDPFNPTVHDAVSAEDVARHLEWTRSDPSGAPALDIARALRALEALCHENHVVCFTRARLRRGERGEIRLYCTAQHLERLTRLLADLESEPSAPETDMEEAHTEAR